MVILIIIVVKIAGLTAMPSCLTKYFNLSELKTAKALVISLQ